MDVSCVHTFQHDGSFFVVDGNSGAIHQLDAAAAAVVEYLRQGKAMSGLCAALASDFSAEVVGEALGEIRQLQAAGLLFTDDTTKFPKRPDFAVKALCLNVAHDCNLRCRYCFAETGDFGGQRLLMSEATAKAAVDFLLSASGARRRCEIDFFGGEPLLNWNVVVAATLYGRTEAAKIGKDIRFTLTTNGMLLDDEKSAFLHKYMDNVVLSLDGRREVNDQARRSVNGRGSVYDTVVPKYQHFVGSRGSKHYYVRGTFTRDHLDFSRDVLHMADLGFTQVSMEPVVADADCSYALRPDDLPRVLQEYEVLAAALQKRRAEGRGFNFFHFQLELKKGPCLYKRIAGCGAGGEYLAVDPTGVLYPCHQFVGQDPFVLGSLADGVVNRELAAALQASHVLNKPACKVCWAKYYCSGGCHANNLRFGGSLQQPYELSCAMEKKRLECSIALFASQHRQTQIQAGAGENVSTG